MASRAPADTSRAPADTPLAQATALAPGYKLLFNRLCARLLKHVHIEADVESPLDLTMAAATTAEIFRRLDCDSSALQPDASLVQAYAGRGREQWVYGEVTGNAALLTMLLAVPVRGGTRAEVCDVGSGTGRLVAFAALAGLRATGIELVPQRHAIAEEAHAALLQRVPAAAARARFRCEDALAVTEPLEGATHVLCNNAVWADRLNADIARHVATAARELVALAMLKALSAEALETSGLVLTRRSAVAVSWDPVGWPVYIYCPRVAVGDAAEVQTDQSFHVAEASRLAGGLAFGC
mmetsp:Transcript_19024/g.56773  ORF Transcript_19024/g.56773 Transcript_19024/m.56773 type:complete len:296 (+) Transcript_19024:26-913(+)|eukprot:7389671-Prymnesium_polylepis.1